MERGEEHEEGEREEEEEEEHVSSEFGDISDKELGEESAEGEYVGDSDVEDEQQAELFADKREEAGEQGEDKEFGSKIEDKDMFGSFSEEKAGSSAGGGKKAED